MGDEAVWVEKTGRTVDGAARAVRAWADSRHCDFRGGVPLSTLLKSVLDHHLHAIRGPAPDLCARSLGGLLKGLSNEFPTHFAKCPGRRVGWRCAPLLSYLESSLLPHNKVIVDRRTFKKGVAAVDAARKVQQGVRQEARRVSHPESCTKTRAKKCARVGTGQGQQRSELFKHAHVEVKTICPTVSMRQLPMLGAIMALAYATEAGCDQLTLDKIAQLAPTAVTLGRWVDERSKLEDLSFEEATEHVGVAYAQFDAGNKGGREWLWQVYSYWDHVAGCVRRWYAEAIVAGKSGPDAADEVHAAAASKKLSLVGSTTDSASNVINGVVKSLREGKVGTRAGDVCFSGAGCLLHVLNLVLMNGFIAAYGDEVMGVVSPLRVGYMVAYLDGKYAEDFEVWCGANGHHDAVKPSQAWKGRWWSVMRAFGDIEDGREIYRGFFVHMANGLKSDCTFQPLFKEVAGWLGNDVCRASMLFVSAFCESWWNEEFTYCQDVDERMADQPARNRYGGHHAHRYARKSVTVHLDLIDLAENFETRPEFSRWRAVVATLSTEDQADQLQQARTFFKFSLQTFEKHFERWLTELVDTAVADDARVGVPVARRLIEIYDDLQPTSVAAGDIILDGVSLNLSDLVDAVTQFATSAGLRERSVLFMRGEELVGPLRRWVGADGDFGAAPELRDIFGRYIYAMAHSTHHVERFVGEGTLICTKYSGTLAEERLSALVTSRRNFTIPEAQDAFEAYKATGEYVNRLLAAAKVAAAQTKPARVANSYTAKRLVAAKARDVERKAEGNDRATRVNTRKRSHAGGIVASAQTKTRFTADDLAAEATASTPAVPLSATGFLDLSKTKKKDAGASLTKDLLATELRARGEIVEVKGAKGEVKETKTELLGRLEKYVVDGKLARFSDLDG
ncbi:hypothetical protein M885DRAFT_624780, partial [Pelagophyceae sp. CCMP2097]